MGLTATPLDSGARIAALDAIRGVALLGILLANVRQMFLPWEVAAFAVPARNGSDLLAWLDWGFFDSLVDLKFITLFSLLFGAGFALPVLFLFMILMLVIRPSGLFGLGEIQRL